ncbi:hypothetical protein FHG87_014723 [Trinorchestia longiramus]|nr:hypothetical protein FHG87_014723 [Trinorchestia longiramus]
MWMTREVSLADGITLRQLKGRMLEIQDTDAVIEVVRGRGGEVREGGCNLGEDTSLVDWYHQLGRLVSESVFEREDPGSNPAADMVDAARNTAWDLGKQPNNYRSNYPTQEWARRCLTSAVSFARLTLTIEVHGSLKMTFPIKIKKRDTPPLEYLFYLERSFHHHQLGRLVSESACERKDPGSNPAANMVDAARNTAWDLELTGFDRGQIIVGGMVSAFVSKVAEVFIASRGSVSKIYYVYLKCGKTLLNHSADKSMCYMPSHAVLPKSHTVLPKSHTVLPKSHAVLPKSHAVLPKSHAVLPKSHAVLPKSHAVLPKSHAVLPKSHTVLPKSHTVLPKSHAVLPKSHAVLPKSHTVLPKSHAVLPKSHATYESYCAAYIPTTCGAILYYLHI